MPTVPGVFIRPGRLADALDMAAVQHAAVHRLAARHYPPRTLAAWAPEPSLARAERLHREAQDNGAQHLCAEAAGAVIGFAVVVPEAGEICGCYVAPDFAGRGVGRLLLAALEQAATAAGVHELAVRSPVNAKGFFSAAGYMPAGRGERGLEDGTSMVVAYMRKDCSPPG